MVFRVYVEKRGELSVEAAALLSDLRKFLGIKSLEGLRMLNRYDVENIDAALFESTVGTVFSEPQIDTVTRELTVNDGDTVFAVEYLPGQFDQRADSAAQCVQIISQGERPTVRTAKIYILSGKLTDGELAAIKKYVINPVECREATLDMPETLDVKYDIPESVKTLHGFISLDREALSAFVSGYGLAMDADDLEFCRKYFEREGRDPTITEIRMIDTYWSDHCRHTTFNTIIDKVELTDPTIAAAYGEYVDMREYLGRKKPQTLMDIGTLAAKHLKKQGKLAKLDESDEINACTVKIKVNVNGQDEDWLLLFKNETHNHPTEIEPFGGAATCIGGAIRDPLSGRAYVYAAMRLTGAADPTRSLSETLAGKLPQRKIVTTAASGYSSYCNQIGLATGQVDEIYHDGYAAKHMELGAVIAATPAANVRRECPEDGDIVILLGGRTGRDGIGGATGSSKSHTEASLENCGAEVQKGNAPEERKLQRLFRNPDAQYMIKRCNDFGAGGVSVAVGELADGLTIDLNAVPKKYEGLDGTELAISESQERMAVVVEPYNVDKFIALANKENLEATVIARVTAEPRLVMTWNGKKIVDISREFLNTDGAEKHITIKPAPAKDYGKTVSGSFTEEYRKLVGDLNVCSKRGLSERFDSTIGANTVLMPFGGKNQLTPIQAMVHKIAVEKNDTDTCSYMSWGYNPDITSASPYHGAYLAVVESVAKLVATGAEFSDVYLSLQEFFEKPLRDPARWGKPFSAVLGALMAQKELGIAAIGGKDSMSGSFEKLDVPPTVVSFAVTTGKLPEVITNDAKAAGHKLISVCPKYENGLPVAESLIETFSKVTSLMRAGKVYAAYTPTYGGIAEAVYKMCIGNGLGFEFDPDVTVGDIFGYAYGSFLLEVEASEAGQTVGRFTDDGKMTLGGESVEFSELNEIYEGKLERVYPCNIGGKGRSIPVVQYKTAPRKSSISVVKPRVLIPVFPGTNCEYDSAKAVAAAGAEPEIIVINNLTPKGVSDSVDYFAKRVADAQMIFIPGGFSGGDEPDGSGKFITAFFRNGAVKEATNELLSKRDGLVLGICNGFQALIKLGLVPYGEIIDTDENCPTLTFNKIGRHQSKLVRTRVASNLSPWLANAEVGGIYTVPISHGEGRFWASPELIAKLAAAGQIATQYVDANGVPTDDVAFNPNDSAWAIEGITSPDGRVLGKMGHSERVGAGLYKNVEGDFNIGLFTSAVDYYKI